MANSTGKIQGESYWPALLRSRRVKYLMNSIVEYVEDIKHGGPLRIKSWQQVITGPNFFMRLILELEHVRNDRSLREGKS